MSRPDPFGFDMSVKSSKKKNPRGRRGMTGEQETSTRICEHEGCDQPGKFRAPKAPDVLDDFYWFCKDHVREYNARWSFFDGKTEAEMNAQASADKVWERRTKDWRDPEARAWEPLLDPTSLKLRVEVRGASRSAKVTSADPVQLTATTDALRFLRAKHWDGDDDVAPSERLDKLLCRHRVPGASAVEATFHRRGRAASVLLRRPGDDGNARPLHS